jgi:hypothetical protein
MPTRFIFDERFVEALAHAEHRIMGERLAPFSAWHELNLQLIDSPLLTGEPCSWGDLVAAVRVCVTRYRSGCPTPDLAPRGLAKWRWKWRMARGDLRRELAAFGRYLDDYYSPPKFWKNDHLRKEGELAAAERDREFDEILEGVCFLWHQTGAPLELIWNMPVGEARWYGAQIGKWVSQSQDRWIWTPTDEKAFGEHKRKKEATIQGWADEHVKAGMDAKEARAKAEAEYKRRSDAFMARVRGEGEPPSGVQLAAKQKASMKGIKPNGARVTPGGSRDGR